MKIFDYSGSQMDEADKWMVFFVKKKDYGEKKDYGMLETSQMNNHLKYCA